jgi:uncharacterized protein YciI
MSKRPRTATGSWFKRPAPGDIYGYDQEVRRLFVVTRVHGPAWDDNKQLESQYLWPEHAAFMDDLTAKGFVLLGGPYEDGREALLIIDASDEAAIRETLARDPWTPSGHLETGAVRPSSVRLEANEYR